MESWGVRLTLLDCKNNGKLCNSQAQKWLWSLTYTCV